MRWSIAVLVLAWPRGVLAEQGQLTRNELPEESIDLGCPGEISPPDGSRLPSNPTIFITAGVGANASAYQLTSSQPVGYVARTINDVVRIDVGLEAGTLDVHHPNGRLLARYTVAPRPPRHVVQLMRVDDYTMRFELLRSNAIAFRIKSASGTFHALPAGVLERYQTLDLSGRCDLVRRLPVGTRIPFEMTAIFADGEERRLGSVHDTNDDEEDCISFATSGPSEWSTAMPVVPVAVALALLSYYLALVSHSERKRSIQVVVLPRARVVRR